MTTTPFQQLHPLLREAIGVHSIIEKMGFSMADIYMQRAPNAISGDIHVFVMLKTQGREFIYDCGPSDISEDAWQNVAKAAFRAWNAASQTERECLFEHCEARKDAVLMLSAIVAKGITPPGGEL